MSTVCPKCNEKGYFRYSLGFSYKVSYGGKKTPKKVIYIPDSITCLQCEFSWSVKDE